VILEKEPSNPRRDRTSSIAAPWDRTSVPGMCICICSCVFICMYICVMYMYMYSIYICILQSICVCIYIYIHEWIGASSSMILFNSTGAGVGPVGKQVVFVLLYMLSVPSHEYFFLIDSILYLCRSGWFRISMGIFCNPLPCCNFC
jgi:hypothetical protein